MKRDLWRAAAFARDLDRLPRYASDAGAQSFHDGFFGGEAARKLRCAVAGVSLLALGEDFVEESDWVAIADSGDAGDLYEVNAGVYHDSGTRFEPSSVRLTSVGVCT